VNNYSILDKWRFVNDIKLYTSESPEVIEFWSGYSIFKAYENVFSVYLSITSKNDALLNIKHEEEFIRWYCGKVLKNEL
jgi:hypothetical protein